jgi:pSer/pThr/pTyr-binding forkhead associated (FHA) protein
MLRRLLPSFLILPSACVIMILFQMDLTQILGMGFLCVSVIWIIHTSLEKRANEKRNIWFDEDPEAQSDDQFYQALRKELYAEDGGFNTSCQPMQASAGHGMQEEKTRLLHAPGPVLVSLDKDRSQDLPLNRDHLILGKSRSQCDIVLSGDTISRKHARIERRMDGYYVTDLFSTNGTFLDGHRLESGQAVAMKDGAQLTIASTHFRVSIPEQAA